MEGGILKSALEASYILIFDVRILSYVLYGEAEIEDLNDFTFNHEVVKFNISVHILDLVHLFKSGEHLKRQLDDGLLRSFLSEVLLEGHVQVLYHQVGNWIVIGSVEDWNVFTVWISLPYVS